MDRGRKGWERERGVEGGEKEKGREREREREKMNDIIFHETTIR